MDKYSVGINHKSEMVYLVSDVDKEIERLQNYNTRLNNSVCDEVDQKERVTDRYYDAQKEINRLNEIILGIHNQTKER